MRVVPPLGHQKTANVQQLVQSSMHKLTGTILQQIQIHVLNIPSHSDPANIELVENTVYEVGTPDTRQRTTTGGIELKPNQCTVTQQQTMATKLSKMETTTVQRVIFVGQNIRGFHGWRSDHEYFTHE